MTARPASSPPTVRPPETIDAGPILLQRNLRSDADELARTVRDSLEHLMPWMPWADERSATAGFQAERLIQVEAQWDAGTDFVFVLRRPEGGDSILGVIGLHRRIGPGAIEIGYFTHVDHAGRGYMSAAAEAVTDAAGELDDVDRIEIHTDEANVRSSAIPRKLGYRLDRIDKRLPEAPGECGRLQIWITP